MLRFHKEQVNKLTVATGRGWQRNPFPGTYPTRIRMSLRDEDDKTFFEYNGKPTPEIYAKFRGLKEPLVRTLTPFGERFQEYDTRNILRQRMWGPGHEHPGIISGYYLLPWSRQERGIPNSVFEEAIPIRTLYGSVYYTPRLWDGVDSKWLFRSARNRARRNWSFSPPLEVITRISQNFRGLLQEEGWEPASQLWGTPEPPAINQIQSVFDRLVGQAPTSGTATLRLDRLPEVPPGWLDPPASEREPLGDNEFGIDLAEHWRNTHNNRDYVLWARHMFSHLSYTMPEPLLMSEHGEPFVAFNNPLRAVRMGDRVSTYIDADDVQERIRTYQVWHRTAFTELPVPQVAPTRSLMGTGVRGL